MSTIRPEQELDPERLLSPGEMARRWGISRAMVYDLLGEGCPSLKIGRARRLRVSDADAWLSERQAMTRTEERPITGRTVTIELPQAVAARFAQRSPLSSGRDERALIIACQDAVDPAPAIPVAHLDHDALIALAREEISSDRRPSVRAYEDEHNARIRSARARCDELGIEWREATS